MNKKIKILAWLLLCLKVSMIEPSLIKSGLPFLLNFSRFLKNFGKNLQYKAIEKLGIKNIAHSFPKEKKSCTLICVKNFALYRKSMVLECVMEE